MMLEFFIIKKRISEYLDKIQKNKKDLVLDLGCGSNPYYHKYLEGSIVCFDKVKTKKVHVIGDADFLPFRDNYFDKIISVNSFYYFKNPFDAINSIGKKLKENGKLILVLPFFYPIHDAPADKYRFTEYGLRALLEKNLKIEKLVPIGGIFTFPSVVLHSMIKGLSLAPKSLKIFADIIACMMFPIYIASQFLSLLDFMDRTKKVPTYYFVMASKS